MKALFIVCFTLLTYICFAVERPKVMVLKIRKGIDPSMNRYVSLGMQEAEKSGASLVLIDMDTYGGGLTDADEIRKLLLDCKIPVYVYINKNAASAGALISIACDSIYMAPGSTIGAATVVTEDGKPAPDKYQSYMRSLMRSTAQVTGRDPLIAEKMVGEFAGPDSNYIAHVLSLSSEEAVKQKYCTGIVNSEDEILKRSGMKDATIIRFENSAVENIIGFFLQPYLRSILILLIIAGIYFELQSPGIGFALLTAIVASLLYFIPSYLNGLAEYWEIAVFLVGLVLIILEIFVIPGFGLAGISGIVFTLAGLVLVMLNNDFFDFTFVDAQAFSEALVVLLIATAGSIILVFFGAPRIFSSKAFRKISLQESLTAASGYTANFLAENMVGKEGIAHTVLRPSGKIEIMGNIYDAFSQGEFIERGAQVVVTDQVSNSLKVKIKNA